MSISLVASEIRRLLSTPDPEVICISGRWGVGKSYAWRHYLNEALARKGGIALTHYSYVSLFGINSLDAFKYSIFLNTADVVPADTPSKSASLKAKAKNLGKKLLPLQDVPAIKDRLGDVSTVWFSLIRDTIICIDDIERHGDDLKIKDVLGLVSFLKEAKGCKIILILNDEQLNDSVKPFKTYFEKVIDVHLKFEPSAEESVRIALPSTGESSKMLGRSCVTLNISNIRVIKKIERLVRIVEPMIAQYHPKLLQQAVQSLALFGWCVYEPNLAPSIDYVTTFNRYLLEINKNEKKSENQAAWNKVLLAYNFTDMDDFDRVLLDGVKNGYFNQKELEEHATKLDKAFKDGQSAEAFKEAWELYHGSFDNNQDAVLDGIAKSFKQNVHIISPLDLNGTVTLLKELGRSQQAKELIEFYIKSRGESPVLFDLNALPFGNEVKDPDVRTAFDQKRSTVERKRDPKAILLELAMEKGWNPDDIQTLTDLTVDSY